LVICISENLLSIHFILVLYKRCRLSSPEDSKSTVFIETDLDHFFNQPKSNN